MATKVKDLVKSKMLHDELDEFNGMHYHYMGEAVHKAKCNGLDSKLHKQAQVELQKQAYRQQQQHQVTIALSHRANSRTN